MAKWSNVARNALRPSFLPVMLGKVRRRAESNTRAEATEWAAERAISVDEYCRNVDEALWEESLTECARIEADATRRLARCAHDLGGGGAYTLLYFLVRHRRPDVVVETGVAAGWSSRAVLEACAVNGVGSLYSSDFPYFRFEAPEQYVGYVVPEELRGSWSLDVRGDGTALPEIVERVERIDLFHYDSDKSVTGRRFALDLVQPRLVDSSMVLMDDIQDNVFFRDWVRDGGLDALVFEFGGKYVGAIGLGAGPDSIADAEWRTH